MLSLAAGASIHALACLDFRGRLESTAPVDFAAVCQEVGEAAQMLIVRARVCKSMRSLFTWKS